MNSSRQYCFLTVCYIRRAGHFHGHCGSRPVGGLCHVSVVRYRCRIRRRINDQVKVTDCDDCITTFLGSRSGGFNRLANFILEEGVESMLKGHYELNLCISPWPKNKILEHRKSSLVG